MAALVAAVALLHLGLLHGLSPGGTATPAASESGAATVHVRTVPAAGSVAPAPDAAEPRAPPAPPKPAPPDVATAIPVRPTSAARAPAVVDALATAQAVAASGTASPTPTPTAEPAPPTPALAPDTSPQPLPRYRATLPPDFDAEFRLRRGALAGRAQWRFRADQGRYQLELLSRVLGRDLAHLRSEGQVGADGLQPIRFVEGRRGRDQRAVNFQRDAPGGGRISFSGPATELALPAGVQDRISWLLQLAAAVEATPALREPGAEVAMWVVGVRGDADVWTFTVLGTEPQAAADGVAQPALALRREPRRAWDTEVRVWLDPAAHHLPLRATWRHDGDGSAVELEREALSWR